MTTDAEPIWIPSALPAMQGRLARLMHDTEDGQCFLYAEFAVSLYQNRIHRQKQKAGGVAGA